MELELLNIWTLSAGEDKVKELAKCELEGKTYKEGEKIYPENSSCHTCLCTKGFNSSVPIESNKDCKKVDCGIELRNLNRLQSGCVPIYYGKSDCCPIDFRCRKSASFSILLFSLLK